MLACRSLALGTCNLVVIALPGGWRLLTGPAPPEVERWRVFGDVCWALAGRMCFRALPGRGTAGEEKPLEGEVVIEPLNTRAAAAVGDPAAALEQVVEVQRRPVGAHDGWIALGWTVRGLGPWRRWLQAAALGVACVRTGRQIRIRLEGEGEGVQVVLEALVTGLRCCA